MTPVFVHELLANCVAGNPSDLAVKDERTTLSYAELDERSLLIAQRLRHEGIRAGDRVLLVLDNCVEYVEIEQALARSGVVRVAVNTRLHPVEVMAIAVDAQPSLAFIQADWLERTPDGFTTGCRVVRVGASAEAADCFEALLDGPVAEVRPTNCADDLVWLLYTSGTTGKPKGVMHSNASVMAMVHLIGGLLAPVGRSDIALHTAPLSHMSGAVALAVMSGGGGNIMRPRFDPGAVLDTIERELVTVLPVVPTQLVMLTSQVEQSGIKDGALESVRVVPYAGSAIAPSRLASAMRIFGSVLVQMYGSSECLMPVTALHPGDHIGWVNELGLPRFASAGQALSKTTVEIMNSDGVLEPPGTAGEIVIRTPTATAGYWHNDDATAELRDGQGRFHSGDIGVLDDHGFLFIVDRKKDMIVSGGFNVYPREVEVVLADMPDVREVAVVGEPHDRWGESVVAVIVPDSQAAMTLDSVQEWCRARLASYKVPRRLVLVDELPKSGAGKILKREIAAAFWTNEARRVGG